jgi:hypothetical protein
MSHPNPTNNRTNKPYLEFISVFLVLIMVFVYCIKKIYSPDLGFHLAAGEWMMQHGEIMKKDVFTYTRLGEKYIDLNWLYQIIIYTIFNSFKSHGLVIFNSLLITGSFLLLVQRIKTMMAPKYHLISLFMIIGIQALPVEIRPHVFSWMFLNLIFYILELYTFKQINRLYFLPLIMIFWINSHSLAILGLVTISIFVAGSFLSNNYKFDKKLILYLLASMAVFLVNPYFVEGSLYPLHQFTLITGGFEKKYIAELQSPFTLADFKESGFIAYLINPTFWLQVLAVITLISSYKLFKMKKYTALLLCLAYLFILNLAVKNYGYFFFATLPYTLLGLKNIYSHEANVSKQKQSWFTWQLHPLRTSIFVSFLAVIITITSITDGYSIIRKIQYRFGTSFDEQFLPVQATQFLTENKLKGKVLNHLDFGGYLDQFYKGPVYIDGRLEVFGEGIFEEYFRSRVENNGIQNLLVKYNPDIVILPYIKSTSWWIYFIQSTEWRAIYVDCNAVIYVRKNLYPTVKTIDENYFLRTIPQYNTDQLIAVASKSKPNHSTAFLNSIYKKQNEAIDYENLSMYCFTVGFTKAALAFSMANIDQSTVASQTVYYNLYQYFSERGDYSTANKCLQTSNRKRN